MKNEPCNFFEIIVKSNVAVFKVIQTFRSKERKAPFGQGNETSALTTSNTILMLAMYPEIQERVFKELTEVYDTNSSESTMELIGKLEYMEMVIKETMRLLPVGPFLGRECQANTQICIPDTFYYIIYIFGYTNCIFFQIKQTV